MNHRADFPILNQKIGKYPLIYLDNAATTQKPLSVIRALEDYYCHQNSNIHRGAHHLANMATEHFEHVRTQTAQFLNAPSPREINFTKGTTESINLLMYAHGLKNLKKGDEILISEMEHHANIVPWLYLRDHLGIELKYIPMLPSGILDIWAVDSLISPKTKLVSIAYISNALGTIHPVQNIIQKAKSAGALVHLDIAQAVAHCPIDVQQLGIDFCSFSAHKVYGPTGLGVFWGRGELLENMNPFLYGGEMIKEVYMDRVVFNEIPYKFEAGTPNIADVVAFGASLDYLDKIGFEKLQQMDNELYSYLYEALRPIEKIKIYSPENHSIGALSFNIGGLHSYDVGQMLDARGIAIRTGHHCCQPLMRALGIEGTCRASLALYNTKEEIDVLGKTLEMIVQKFA